MNFFSPILEHYLKLLMLNTYSLCIAEKLSVRGIAEKLSARGIAEKLSASGIAEKLSARGIAEKLLARGIGLISSKT